MAILSKNIEDQNFSHEVNRKAGPFSMQRPLGQGKNNNSVIDKQKIYSASTKKTTTTTKPIHTNNCSYSKDSDNDNCSNSNNNSNNNKNNIARTFNDVPNCSQDLLAATRGLILEEFQIHPECFFRADIERLLHDDWFLTRFLLRRQMEANEAVKLIKECGLFRHQYNVHPELTYKDFPLEFFTMAGIFPYKKDRFGNQTLILRTRVHNPQMIAKLDLQMELKRYLLYSMEQSDILNSGRGIAVVFDMSHASLSNLDWDLLTWMVGSFRRYCPKVVSYILVYNLPWFLSAPMKLASSTLLTDSNRKRLSFVQGKEIMDFIAAENLPDFLGGSCQLDYQSTSLVDWLRSDK